MEKFKRYVPIDYSKYEKEEGPFEAKYGLPEKVKICKRCLISNQRPNSETEHTHNIETSKKTVVFDDEGVCDACRFAEIKHADFDWDKRERELSELCDRFRRSDGEYDCLVPGSGGKDSHYAAYLLKYKYKMHPLLMTFSPHAYTPWGWDNLQSWINGGSSHIMYSPMGRVYRLLTRIAFETLLHPLQPFIFGLKNMAPKAAITYKIPLVFYGENEAEYGNPIDENKISLRDARYYSIEDRSKAYLAGTPISELIDSFGLEEADLRIFLPPRPEELETNRIQVHQLGYYLKWHPQRAYYYASEQGDFKPSPERSVGTHTKYSCIDDKMDDFHYYTYFMKFGMGRETHEASQEIRSGDITREEGLALVKRYDGEFPKRFSEDLFRYMSIEPKEYPVASQMFEQPTMDLDYFLHLTERFRSPHLWKYRNSEWELRHKVIDEMQSTEDGHEEEARVWQGNVYKPFK